MAARKTKAKARGKSAPTKAKAKATRFAKTVELAANVARTLGIAAGTYRISTLCYALWSAGKSNDEVVEAVRRFFPDSECAAEGKRALIIWYRFNGLRTGKIPADAVGAETKAKSGPKRKVSARKTATKGATKGARRKTARKA